MQQEQRDISESTWSIRPQTVRDRPTGLTLQFVVGADGLPRIKLSGSLPFGNREIGFGPDGLEAFSGTGIACPAPSD